MEERRLLIKKKTALSKVKRNLELFKSFQTVDIIEADSEEITKYREQIEEMNHYSFPKLATRKLDKDNDIMIEWFFQQIPILRDNTIWIIPFDEMGIWWIKILTINCRESIEQLWDIGEICIIEQETKRCYYIQIDEDNCNIVFKQLK
ncbi:hypothetical protein FDF12_09890 [Clostridium botulinum]|uniref:hypothetical protein n=1 Tax=Clostridium sp. ZBS20 TaxID=2949966 RepID=UPI0013F0F735|nr:hypothetical protein [Clostridium sp. ZBS20]MBN1052890.1 hypothetical protein [Clostridium botulinum]NFS28759.1 hypothetical protein [Clostridium botulinum]NFS55192.1 hypothetical protein [Clostridium botulinum]NFT17683.1 hypothetical protein [Clostridium botulinum]